MIEILAFRLKEGADEAAFLAADKKVQVEFAYQQPGLLRRTTARAEDGNWMVIDIWQTAAHADACDARWGTDEVSSEFMTFVDESTVRSKRFFELD